MTKKLENHTQLRETFNGHLIAPVRNNTEICKDSILSRERSYIVHGTRAREELRQSIIPLRLI